MKRYAYGFGFETPTQWTLNRKHGWDDEDSAIIIIHADDADAARAWGREIADASVRQLFERARAPEIPKWKDLQYVDSIEEAGPEHDGVEVEVGQMPPLDWLGQE
jgi:hypothetical protein